MQVLFLTNIGHSSCKCKYYLIYFSNFLDFFSKMDAEIHDRITKLIDIQYNGSKLLFCKKNEIKEGTFYSMFKKQTNPSFDMIQAILSHHRELNPYWLILGEGDMHNPPNDELPVLRKKVEDLQKEMDYLKEINELLKLKR